MIIGLVFSGRMKSLDNQWIETQYFAIGIPLVPVKSIFVTKADYRERGGFEIGLFGPSVLKGYLSLGFLVSAVFLTLIGAHLIGEVG